MGYYADATIALMKSGKGSEAKTIEVIKMLDKEVFEPLLEANHSGYWMVMRKMHEIYNGCHFDESFALWEVAQMHHTDKAGMVHKGEHWTLAQVQEVFNKYKTHLKPQDNVYDMYVALHAGWHDGICLDTEYFGTDAEAKNIERSVDFYFMDEDFVGGGKIWKYCNAMRGV